MCGDPDIAWFPQASVCYASMAQAAATAEYHARTEKYQWHDGSFLAGPQHWAEKRSAKFRFHRDFGVTIFVTQADLRMGGVVLTGKPQTEPESVPLDDDV